MTHGSPLSTDWTSLDSALAEEHSYQANNKPYLACPNGPAYQVRVFSTAFLRAINSSFATRAQWSSFRTR